MRIEDIKTIVSEDGLPTTYYQWHEQGVPPLPYKVWYLPNSRNVAADNKVYKRRDVLVVELYSEERDFDAEAAFEAVLDRYKIVWDKTCDYIDSEQMYQTTYEAELFVETEQLTQEE